MYVHIIMYSITAALALALAPAALNCPLLPAKIGSGHARMSETRWESVASAAVAAAAVSPDTTATVNVGDDIRFVQAREAEEESRGEGGRGGGRGETHWKLTRRRRRRRPLLPPSPSGVSANRSGASSPEEGKLQWCQIYVFKIQCFISSQC